MQLLQVDLFHLLRILSCPCFSRNSGQASLFDTKWPNFWSKKKLYTKAGNLMIWRRWPVFLTDYGLMMYRFQTLYGPNHNQNPNKYSFKMPEKLFFYEKNVINEKSRTRYSCNKITNIWIQIFPKNWNGFFSNISHQMMI